jgi:hypothetical protein
MFSEIMFSFFRSRAISKLVKRIQPSPLPLSDPTVRLWTQVVHSFKQVSVQNSFTRLAKHVNGFPCKNDPFDGYGTFLVRQQFFSPTPVNSRNRARESAVALSVR